MSGASIRMQLELAAQHVLIKSRRAAMVKLIFEARPAIAEALELTSNDTIAYGAFAECPVDLPNRLHRARLKLILVKDNSLNLILAHHD